MNSATHLLNEDRPEFERALDEALCADDIRAALASSSSQLNAEQLRTLILGSTAAIAACAATEYQHLLKIREQIRHTVFSVRYSPGRQDSAHGGISRTVGEVAEGAGAGLAAVITVLTPILAGTAALIFLLVGYSLELVTPEPSLASPLRTAGWFFAVVATAGAVLGMIALLLTALRNPAADAANDRVERSSQVTEARAAWRKALLERGVRPYIHQVLADATTHTPGELSARNGKAEAPPSRHPRLGYSRPGFSSPKPDGPNSPRRFPEFTSPEYSSPEFSSPEFTSPDFDTGSDHPDIEPAP